MAQDFITNVGIDFPLEQFAQKLSQMYFTKGYLCNMVHLDCGIILSLEKDLGGANSILGLGTGLKVNLYVSNGILTVSYTDEEWTSKIIAVALGLALGGFVLPAALIVTGLIGVYNQSNLSKDISNDVKFLLSTMYR